MTDREQAVVDLAASLFGTFLRGVCSSNLPMPTEKQDIDRWVESSQEVLRSSIVNIINET